MIARLEELEQSRLIEPSRPEEDTQVIERVLADTARVLSSSSITDGEKHDLLAMVVEKMVPADEGEYRLYLRGLEGVEKGHNIRIL